MIQTNREVASVSAFEKQDLKTTSGLCSLSKVCVRVFEWQTLDLAITMFRYEVPEPQVRPTSQSHIELISGNSTSVS